MTDDVLSWALRYASLGWPGIPLHSPRHGGRSCPDPECSSIGNHPRTDHGLKDAATDPEMIRSWFQPWPDSSWGLRTGIAFDVLDIDSEPAARALAIAAELAGADTDACWGGGPMSTTGRGSHILYLPTGARNGAELLGIKGVDWRGADGYIVAPPSLHHTGIRYRWADTNPHDFELEPAPVFLVALLLNLPAKVAPLRGGVPRWIIAGLVAFIEQQAEGSRNHSLNWAAHTLGTHVFKGELSRDHGERALNCSTPRYASGCTSWRRNARSTPAGSPDALARPHGSQPPVLVAASCAHAPLVPPQTSISSRSPEAQATPRS